MCVGRSATMKTIKGFRPSQIKQSLVLWLRVCIWVRLKDDKVMTKRRTKITRKAYFPKMSHYSFCNISGGRNKSFIWVYWKENKVMFNLSQITQRGRYTESLRGIPPECRLQAKARHSINASHRNVCVCACVCEIERWGYGWVIAKPVRSQNRTVCPAQLRSWLPSFLHNVCVCVCVFVCVHVCVCVCVCVCVFG